MAKDKPTKSKSALPETTPVRMGGRLLLDLSSGAYTSIGTALKEYVSNSWDAGANSIIIRVRNPNDVESTTVDILDNGCGMTRADLDSKFFRIGRDRRKEEGSVIKTIRGRRAVHGRKGLGKLAGLKFADKLTVTTWQGNIVNTAWLDLAEVHAAPNNEPLVHWVASPKKPSGAGKSGTLIRLTQYSRPHVVDVHDLWWNLCLWFEFGDRARVILEQITQEDGKTTATKKWSIARSEVFKRLKTTRRTEEVEWSEDGKTHAKEVTVRWGWLPESNTKVRSMISVFSETRALSTQEDFDLRRGWTNMFGIYKLVAQFNVPWLDHMPGVDPADLKREGINWDLHPALEALRDYGQKWVVEACRAQAGSKKGVSEIRDKATKLVAQKAEFKEWPEAQRRRLIALVTDYASQGAFPTEQLDRLIELFAFLLQHGALISFIQGLKDSGKKGLDEFIDISRDFSTSEITGILSITKSKLQIVKALQRLIKDPKTTEVPRKGKRDITTFLAEAPWIFDPELRIDHIDVPMKRIVLEEEGVPTKQINELPTDYFKIRPDFVGYVGPGQHPLCVELKRPTWTMTEAEALRVLRYRAALGSKYAGLQLIVLSGKFSASADKLLRSIPDVTLMHYSDLLKRASNQLGDLIAKLEKGLEGVADKKSV